MRSDLYWKMVRIPCWRRGTLNCFFELTLQQESTFFHFARPFFSANCLLSQELDWRYLRWWSIWKVSPRDCTF